MVPFGPQIQQHCTPNPSKGLAHHSALQRQRHERVARALGDLVAAANVRSAQRHAYS